MAVHGSSRSAFLPSVELPTSTACASLCSSDHLSLATALVDARVLSLLVVLWPGHLGGVLGKLHVDLRLRRTGHFPTLPRCAFAPENSLVVFLVRTRALAKKVGLRPV